MGLPKLQAQKIQSIINTTVRLISGTRKFDHITSVLENLHWLKIEERIQYEMILKVTQNGKSFLSFIENIKDVFIA